MTQALIAADDWSPQQDQALDQIQRWHRKFDAPFFYLAGWAGTGKTTLAGEVARLIGGKVVYGAYTGKAASVLRAKGCEHAQTLDKLVYWRPCQHFCIKEQCDAKNPVIAHPGCSRSMLDGGAASTLRRSSRMERWLALAVLTTERNAA